MSNAEQVAYQDMLRQCEESLFGGDVQDDKEVDGNDGWINVKDELPLSPKLVWVAVPNVITCRHQVILCYMDSDGQWRDASGILMFRRVSFWQYADVPECNISC
jgi:hypothetical protein